METDYRALLPIDGREFLVKDGRWTARIAQGPIPEASDRLRYDSEFQNESGEKKKLTLWLSSAGLYHDHNQNYWRGINLVIEGWLLTGEREGERRFFEPESAKSASAKS